jgi:hypothetical protein
MTDPRPLEYPCATQLSHTDRQPDANLARGLSVHRKNHTKVIFRWQPRSTLTYFIVEDGFTAEQRRSLRQTMKQAARAWMGTGLRLSFKRTDDKVTATFHVKFSKAIGNNYAIACFPDAKDCTLRIGKHTLKAWNHLFHILCHELGHIIGLRHEFWKEDGEGETEPAVYLTFRKLDPDSVMNARNAKDLTRLAISRHDAEDARMFYRLPAGRQSDSGALRGYTIVDRDPKLPKAFSKGPKS